jgi:hypothetical protein
MLKVINVWVEPWLKSQVFEHQGTHFISLGIKMSTEWLIVWTVGGNINNYQYKYIAHNCVRIFLFLL